MSFLLVSFSKQYLKVKLAENPILKQLAARTNVAADAP